MVYENRKSLSFLFKPYLFFLSVFLLIVSEKREDAVCTVEKRTKAI